MVKWMGSTSETQEIDFISDAKFMTRVALFKRNTKKNWACSMQHELELKIHYINHLPCTHQDGVPASEHSWDHLSAAVTKGSSQRSARQRIAS